MSDLHVKYLLVGGGVASYCAADAIRQRDPQGALLLVGQEINRPYYRAPLSQGFLRRRQSRGSLFTCDPNWFAAHGVQLRTGCRAAHLDTPRRIVTLSSGEAVSYDRLLLATGSSPRPLSLPGGHLPNIFSPRTIEDYEQLRTAVEKAKSEGHRHQGQANGGPASGDRGAATVIGAGALGVEIAASLAQSGLKVDLISGGAHPWVKFAGEATGKFLSHYLSERGLVVHDGVRATGIEGDGRAQRVALSDGSTTACDFVVAAVGTRPNKELLRGTGIIAETAILADEHCRTNIPEIFTAGDCAAPRDLIFGKHRPAEQWDTAAATGAVAGANMAGGEVSLQAVASFSTQVLDLTVRVWGQSKHLHRRLMRGAANLESPYFLEIGVGGDGHIWQILEVRAASQNAAAGDPAVLQELVRRRVPVSGNEEMLKDPASPLEKLLG